MIAKCPACQRRLFGPICPVHGRVMNTGYGKGGVRTSLTGVETSVATVSSDVAALSTDLGVKLPVGNVRDFIDFAGVISAITKASPTRITCTAPHGKTGTFRVYIAGTNCTPAITEGHYTATVYNTTSFTVPFNVSGSSGNNGFVWYVPPGWDLIDTTGHDVGGLTAYYIKYTG